MIKINKVSLVTAGVALAIIIFLTVFIGNDSKNKSPIIDAVPSNVSFVFETNNFTELIEKILKNKIFSEFSESGLFSETFNEIFFLDSLLKNNSDLKEILSGEKIIISAHLTGKKKTDYLYICSPRNSKQSIIQDAVSSLFKDKTKINLTKYDNAKIYSVRFSQNNPYNFYFTRHEGFLLFSFSEVLLQRSVRRLNSDADEIKNKSLKEIYLSSKENSNAKLFVNYKYFTKHSSKILKSGLSETSLLISNFADWSVFDISFTNKNIQFSGYTSTSKNHQYLDLFKSQSPDDFDLLDILPVKTSSFALLNIGKAENFEFNYPDYLSNIKTVNRYRRETANFYKNTKSNNFYKFTGSEIGIACVDINKNGQKHNTYAFIETIDKKNAEVFFNSVIKNYKKNDNFNVSRKSFSHTVSGETYVIKKLPYNNIPYIFFGLVFKNTDAKYYTYIDDYIVFSGSAEAIKDIVNSFKEKDFFIKKSSDASFIKSLSSQSNIFLYANVFHSLNIIKNSLSPRYIKEIDNNAELLKKIKGPSFQLIADSYPVYTHAQLDFDYNPAKVSETVWECRLDTIASSKPFVVINHNTDEKEIFIQDAKNKVYLIDLKGNILWERQLSDKILGDVCQIDYYKNNKLQLLFNSKKNIYLIDRIGNFVAGFPVKLESSATNGLTLVDYDHNKEYRIFLATKNKKISLYDKSGKTIKGWSFEKTKGIVSNRIKYFRYKSKDYIVFNDDSKIYFLNRRGEERIKVVTGFPIGINSEIFFEGDTKTSRARFLTTSPNGNVYFVYLNGDVKKMIIKSFTNKHFFSYMDITGDAVKEFIYTDIQQTEVYDRNKKRLFSYSFNNEIDIKPKIYKFSSKNTKIGIVSKKDSKIYLLNKNGTLTKGFPLKGCNLFSICNVSDSEDFSLIVGSNDSYVYKYNLN